jgi:hypothetical protein
MDLIRFGCFIVWKPLKFFFFGQILIVGWVCNINGPMGILLASILGISRTMYCDSENRLDIIPVDICAKSLIIAAWKNANETR